VFTVSNISSFLSFLGSGGKLLFMFSTGFFFFKNSFFVTFLYNVLILLLLIDGFMLAKLIFFPC
jgi:hypothetical protein